MKPLQGVEHKEGEVCEILQSLYGLKQSSHLWNLKIAGFIESIGFKAMSADPSVFTNNWGMIIVLYVDDLLVFGWDTASITPTKKKLVDFHLMKDSGCVEKILGIHVTWKNNQITLDQQYYSEQILMEFGMQNSHPTTVPLGKSVDLQGESTPELKSSKHHEYWRMIGQLMYLTTTTQPDIQYTMNTLSQYLSC